MSVCDHGGHTAPRLQNLLGIWAAALAEVVSEPLSMFNIQI